MNTNLNIKSKVQSNKQPIGIFDSGVGGLSVLQQTHQLLAHENFIYVADSAHAPWGAKGDQFIEQRSRVITEHLLEQGAKLIVIACNTATASIIENFRQQYGIPFVGVEPGIKPAIALSKNGNIGIMATQSTLSSQRYKDLIQRFPSTINLHHMPCPGLADQVECCQLDSPETIDLLNKFIQPLLSQGIDTLVLGCTHYSFLRPMIKNIIGESITLIDTSSSIAEQINRILNKNHIEKTDGHGTSRYFTSGDIENNRMVMSRLLQQNIIELNSLS